MAIIKWRKGNFTGLKLILGLTSSISIFKKHEQLRLKTEIVATKLLTIVCFVYRESMKIFSVAAIRNHT